MTIKTRYGKLAWFEQLTLVAAYAMCVWLTYIGAH
jgi:hypothetical protein